MIGPQHPSAESVWTLDNEDVRRHVSGCTQCAREHDRLALVQSELATRLVALAGDASAPPAVVQRLTDALAAEAGDRGVTVVPIPADRGSPRPRGGIRLLVAASVAVLGLLGVGVLTSLPGNDEPLAGTDGAAVSVPSGADESAGPAEALTREGDGGSASDALQLPGLPVDLVAVGRSLTPGESASNDCGRNLAAATGSTLVASRDLGPPAEAGVLVALDEPSGETLWWVPDCAARPADAWARTPLDG